jgi:vancomycin resistance protein VanJ
VCVLALGLAAGLGLHFLVPDIAGVGLVLESALPWLGLLIPVLLIAAFVSRSRGAVVAALVPLLVWVVMFGPALVPLSWSAPAASDSTLTVASQNVEAGSGTAGESARALAETGAQVIALQEMDDAAREEVVGVLGEAYPIPTASARSACGARTPSRTPRRSTSGSVGNAGSPPTSSRRAAP